MIRNIVDLPRSRLAVIGNNKDNDKQVEPEKHNIKQVQKHNIKADVYIILALVCMIILIMHSTSKQ